MIREISRFQDYKKRRRAKRESQDFFKVLLEKWASLVSQECFRRVYDLRHKVPEYTRRERKRGANGKNCGWVVKKEYISHFMSSSQILTLLRFGGCIQEKETLSWHLIRPGNEPWRQWNGTLKVVLFEFWMKLKGETGGRGDFWEGVGDMFTSERKTSDLVNFRSELLYSDSRDKRTIQKHRCLFWRRHARVPSSRRHKMVIIYVIGKFKRILGWVGAEGYFAWHKDTVRRDGPTAVLSKRNRSTRIAETPRGKTNICTSARCGGASIKVVAVRLRLEPVKGSRRRGGAEPPRERTVGLDCTRPPLSTLHNRNYFWHRQVKNVLPSGTFEKGGFETLHDTVGNGKEGIENSRETGTLPETLDTFSQKWSECRTNSGRNFLNHLVYFAGCWTHGSMPRKNAVTSRILRAILKFQTF